LRHVGAGYVADLETVAGGLEVGFQRLHLHLVQPHGGLGAQHIQIGGHHLGKHIGLGGAQIGAARHHARIGGADRVFTPPPL
jgi:hypothetical protein